MAKAKKKSSRSAKKRSVKSQPTKNRPVKRANRRLVLTGIVLVFLGILVVSRAYPNLGFHKEPVDGEVSASAFSDSNSKNPDQKVPSRIIIPGVGIDLPVKTAKIIRGYWQVFEDTAAWGEESGFPGNVGNQVIFAHARKGLFLPLREVKVGDKIYVMTNDAWFAYEIKEIKDVYPNQKEVIEPTTDETLTVYTCTGYEDSKRLIVIAKRV